VPAAATTSSTQPNLAPIVAAAGISDWPFLLLWVVLGVLLLESWLFHRKAVF
jgi:hypothetical protein